MVYALEKCDLQSIVQTAAEFHDSNLHEIEHVLFLPVSGASFLCQKNASRQVFWRKKLLRQKLAQETCQSNEALAAVGKLVKRGMHVYSWVGCMTHCHCNSWKQMMEVKLIAVCGVVLRSHAPPYCRHADMRQPKARFPLPVLTGNGNRSPVNSGRQLG